MSAGFPWDQLGIAPTKDRKAIRSAYAAKLKMIDPDADIAGFAGLRDARDEALWLAKQPDAAPGEPESWQASFGADPLGYEGPAGDGDLTVSAPHPQEPNLYGPDYGARAADPDAARRPLGAGWDGGGGSGVLDVDIGNPLDPAIASGEGDVGGRPLHDDQPFPEEDGNAFLEVLAPGGQFTDEPLTGEEYERGAELMRSMIASAHGSAIDRQGNIEDWLAHYLASSWPRSGPLVEDAVAAFGWDREAGRIDEHRAVAFLNARLDAMAVLGKISTPGHKWHKAYLELRKPGPRPKNPFRRKAKDADVVALLNAVRGHHPELEEYFDGDRVASYEEPDEVGNPWGWVGLVVVVLWVVARVFVLAGNGDEDSGAQAYSGSGQSQEWSAEEKQEFVASIFGDSADQAIIAAQAPNAWPPLQRAFRLDPDDPAEQALGRDLVRQALRRDISAAVAYAPFEELVAIRQHRLDMLREAREQAGNISCSLIANGNGAPDQFAFSDAFIAKERDLIARLLEAGLLQPREGEFPKSAPIPGDMVAQVMRLGGYSEEKFTQLASGQGELQERCDFAIAMDSVMLERPGTVSIDLLRLR